MGRRALRIGLAVGLAVGIAAGMPGGDGPRAETATPTTLQIVGSGTLRPALEALAAVFAETHPHVVVQIESRGSSTGPPALLAERADLASLSRPLYESERQAFVRRYGEGPVSTPLATDAVVVFVNAENPLPRLTLAEVDAIFSSTLRCGAPAPIERWGDLGLAAPFDDRRLHVYGRNARSGTRAWFREVALCDGLFRESLRERPGPESLVLSVAERQFGIAYGSRATGLARGLRMVPLARDTQGPFVLPDAATVASGTYPLARRLELVSRPGPLSEVAADFLALATSDAGQAVVEEAGFLRVR